MLSRQFITKSERRLISIHNAITPKIKSFKRFFIEKGKMMTIFENITWMYEAKDFSGILQVSECLERSIPVHWVPRYYKYHELLYYCVFLEKYHYRTNDLEGLELASEMLGLLNVGHELGRAIEKKVIQILKN